MCSTQLVRWARALLRTGVSSAGSLYDHRSRRSPSTRMCRFSCGWPIYINGCEHACHAGDWSTVTIGGPRYVYYRRPYRPQLRTRWLDVRRTPVRSALATFLSDGYTRTDAESYDVDCRTIDQRYLLAATKTDNDCCIQLHEPDSVVIQYFISMW